jgi:hypothetical protein
VAGISEMIVKKRQILCILWDIRNLFLAIGPVDRYHQ